MSSALRLALLVAVLVLPSCGGERLHQQEAFVFGTRIEITVQGLPPDDARAATGAVLREFDRLHHAYHAWQPSELTQLNEALAAGHSATISTELADMLRDAQRLAQLSEHLFEPAIGRLVALWGFHGEEFVPRRPPPEALAALVVAAPRVSDLRLDAGQVSSANGAVAIDLGGYAKGYALDRAASILRDHGVRNALVNIGGNVMALGRKGARPWRVGIQHPRAPGPLATLELHDGEAIGTSGDYQRYFELDGVRYSHLIDPRSGRPADGAESASVLTGPGPGAGVLSDVASKPMFIAAPQDWPRLAARLGVTQVLRVDADGGIAMTPAMAARVKLEPGAPTARIVVLPEASAAAQ